MSITLKLLMAFAYGYICSTAHDRRKRPYYTYLECAR